MHYWSVMSSIVLPIAIVCLFGALMQRWRPVDVPSLADVSLFVLMPCLVIVVLAGAHPSGHRLSQILWFTLLQTGLCWLLGRSAAKLLRLPPKLDSAITLTTIFSNANNYGLPVLLLAYGNTGMVNGATYVIGQIILVNTLGLYVASRSNFRPKQAVGVILKTPIIYAVLVGVLLFTTHATIPGGIADALKMLGDAYPAIVLLILGIQLGRIKSWSQINRRKDVWLAVGLRMVIVPLISALCIWVLSIHGILASILLVQSSMPAAVNTIVLANKYGSDEETVTLTVAVTTLLSFVTLPLLIAIG